MKSPFALCFVALFALCTCCFANETAEECRKMCNEAYSSPASDDTEPSGRECERGCVIFEIAFSMNTTADIHDADDECRKSCTATYKGDAKERCITGCSEAMKKRVASCGSCINPCGKPQLAYSPILWFGAGIVFTTILSVMTCIYGCVTTTMESLESRTPKVDKMEDKTTNLTWAEDTNVGGLSFETLDLEVEQLDYIDRTVIPTRKFNDKLY